MKILYYFSFTLFFLTAAVSEEPSEESLESSSEEQVEFKLKKEIRAEFEGALTEFWKALTERSFETAKKKVFLFEDDFDLENGEEIAELALFEFKTMASWLKKNPGELRFKAHNIKVLPDRGKRKIKSVIV